LNKIYTIGFTKKTLRDFIYRLKKAEVARIIDIRLNNSSQLAGFAKSEDLQFILELVGIEYISVKSLAPDKELLDKYHENGNWDEYEVCFKALMDKRNTLKTLSELHIDKKVSCFLCSEDKPAKCHRRLVAEMLRKSFEIIHL
jgi:uncharacterized protein (DUF488 family)